MYVLTSVGPPDGFGCGYLVLQLCYALPMSASLHAWSTFF